MPTARTVFLCAVAFAAGVLTHRALTPAAPLDVHLSGDGAAQVAARVFTWPGPPRAADPRAAALQVVTFRRWQNIEGMADLMRLCGRACDGEAAVVDLRRPSLDGLTRILLIDVGAYGAGPELDRGAPMDGDVVACLARLIARHRLDRPAGTTDCPAPIERTAWRPRLRTPRPGL